MPIWWRRARFSSCRAAHERKIEASVARSVFREMSIGEENYERSIIPLRSDISRFSRGTTSKLATDEPLGSRTYGQLGAGSRGHGQSLQLQAHDSYRQEA